jgi:hypothetical protein
MLINRPNIMYHHRSVLGLQNLIKLLISQNCFASEEGNDLVTVMCIKSVVCARIKVCLSSSRLVSILSLSLSLSLTHTHTHTHTAFTCVSFYLLIMILIPPEHNLKTFRNCRFLIPENYFHTLK